MLTRNPAQARLARELDRLRRAMVEVGYHRGPLLMSSLRKRWVRLRNPHGHIEFGRHTYLGPGFSLHMPSGGTFITGEGVEFRRNFRAELGGPSARIEFGDQARCTYNVTIQCSTTISIGSRCVFADSATVVDGSHRFRDLDRPMLEQGYDLHPIRIEDDAAIMSKSTVIADVGERAFIAANAVVTRPVPAFSLAMGVPARVVEYFGPSPPGRAGRQSGSGGPTRPATASPG